MAGKSKKLYFELDSKEWPKQLKRLREILSSTPPDNEIMQGVIGLVDAEVRVELRASVEPGLSETEAKRFQGRLGMLLDFKHDLQRIWDEAREQAANGKPVA